MPQRILFLNRWPQYRDGPRWDNRLARPEELVDHAAYQVTYICDAAGLTGVPPGTDEAGVHVLEDLTDRGAVLALVDRLVAEHGTFTQVIALSEYLLDLAAEIRERHGIPGPRRAEADRFRDKTAMKTVLAEAGVAVPRWARCRSAGQVRAEAGRLGYPLILKPVRGASSQGVHRVGSAAELDSALGSIPDLNEYEIEQFVAGDILHADGVLDADGHCLFLVVSRYISTCLDFEQGSAFGSVIQTDQLVRAAAEDFTLRCLKALDLRASAFHLEFFDTGRELVFLEIGARVPGADVPNVIHDVTGVNLFRLWIDAVLGNPIEPPGFDFATGGGWLMIPRPRPLPQRVLTATSLAGRIPYLYKELVPQPGDVLEHVGGYATVQAGRFLYRGGTQDQITEAVRRTLEAFRLTAEPVAAP